MSESESTEPPTAAQIPNNPDVPSEQPGTEFRDDILYVLAGLGGSSYGMGIKRKLEDAYDSEVNHGRLYPNLDALVDRGYIEKGVLDKRTNEYSLTKQARDFLLQDVAWKASQLGLAVEEAEHREWSS